MLEIAGLEAGYGPNPVLFGVDLAIGEGEFGTLLGRNGMGKTTTIRALMGLITPRGGSIRFRGEAIAGLPPEKIARRGIGLVPEGRMVFPTLTVRENLVATSANRLGLKPEWSLERIHALFPRLKERENQFARTLSGGEQQMLAIGRALMTNPRLLILDEATEGLAPVIRDEIWTCLAGLKREGLSILVIDKNLATLKRLADRHVVIEKGRTLWRGDAEALAREEARVHAAIGL
ncbi:MAG: ABC transporter ATP-binding protein [Methylobacterium sp.]|jgi:branched-chain amino acid transport system ATP-binding protein|uniref:ABC transporter ATP-binding protein n=1 Tax=Rhabdaerophilum sp. TaxID=2717341 RepID=UPI002A19F28F|nr:ABC transporter ATP-binding protein [Methylobacterium sp.]MCA3636207.1 ABC transporter ATP-binding protein [Methylobacterium sp.]MCA3638672.1 ABC transporter ATP-binding protein [Methylobacterium sp.]MCA3644342.1 ABC transporter ATP-binding protein [Methylobacterium sp.]MCA3644848.1 ABC transporter ATP-binding protein [Methylobacterium sp.]